MVWPHVAQTHEASPAALMMMIQTPQLPFQESEAELTTSLMTQTHLQRGKLGLVGVEIGARAADSAMQRKWKVCAALDFDV